MTTKFYFYIIIILLLSIIKSYIKSDDTELEDKLKEEFNIEESKFKNGKYTVNELLNFIKENSKNFKNWDIGDKNFFIQVGGYIFFKDEKINFDIIKRNIKEIIVYFREKRKYDFKIYERFTPKESFKINNKTYSDKDLIKTCSDIDKRINNENCCILTNRDIFFITLCYPIFEEKEKRYFYATSDCKIYPFDDFYFEQVSIEYNFIGNKKEQIEDLFPIENVYDILKYLCNNITKVNEGSFVKYEDIIKIVYNNNEEIMISEMLKNNTKDEIDKKLSKMIVNNRKNIKVYTNFLGLRTIKEKEKKNKHVDKISKKRYCERSNC